MQPLYFEHKFISYSLERQTFARIMYHRHLFFFSYPKICHKLEIVKNFDAKMYRLSRNKSLAPRKKYSKHYRVDFLNEILQSVKRFSQTPKFLNILKYINLVKNVDVCDC